MLLPYTTLAYYGEAAAASIGQGATTTSADIKATARPEATIAASASVPLAKPTRLVDRPATIVGLGSVVTALPKGLARPAATIKVNQLTQDDVTGAVLETQIEPGLTVKQALLDARKAAKLAAALSA
jgi:hypothetical protein